MISNRLQHAALFLCIAALPAIAGAAQPSPEPQIAKVMIMGVFHFANPGLDKVKSKVINVMTKENQTYLDGLATRIAAFHPTDVLVECEPADQAKFDAKFAAYKRGTFVPTSSEVYQIGFRVAKAAGIDKVTCFDERTVGFDAEPMFAYLKKNDPKAQAEMEAMFKTLSENQSREQSTLSLAKLLKGANDPTSDRDNKNLYIRTNAVDAGGSFAGADASASWWHRNFRMYANVQKAAARGRRVLVIAGSGHTAILKDLLAIDRQRESEDVTGYLTQ